MINIKAFFPPIIIHESATQVQLILQRFRPGIQNKMSLRGLSFRPKQSQYCLTPSFTGGFLSSSSPTHLIKISSTFPVLRTIRNFWRGGIKGITILLFTIILCFSYRYLSINTVVNQNYEHSKESKRNFNICFKIIYFT